MKTAINIDITYDQVLSIVQKLPASQKLKLRKELEKEDINTKLTSILSAFKTDEISDELITNEVEFVRKRIYESKKH